MNDLIAVSTTIKFLENRLQEFEAEAKKIETIYGKDAAEGFREIFKDFEESLVRLKIEFKRLLN